MYLRTKIREKTIGSRNTLIATPEIEDAEIVGETPFTGPVPFVEVETDTVDNILGKARIDLMKVNVEGTEFVVLKGAEEALKEDWIKNLMIELHDPEKKRRVGPPAKSRPMHYKLASLCAGICHKPRPPTVERSISRSHKSD